MCYIFGNYSPPNYWLHCQKKWVDKIPYVFIFTFICFSLKSYWEKTMLNQSWKWKQLFFQYKYFCTPTPSPSTYLKIIKCPHLPFSQLNTVKMQSLLNSKFDSPPSSGERRIPCYLTYRKWYHPADRNIFPGSKTSEAFTMGQQKTS